MEEKSELRRHFRRLRQALAPDLRLRHDARICELVADFAHRKGMHRLGVFSAIRHEVELQGLVRSHPEWLFFYPRIASTSPPRLVWGTEPLEPGPFGIQEPVFAQHFVPPVQLLLVPGLAFDEAGFRLGYGGGYYDALLDHLQDDVLTLGVGYGLQRTHDLPRSPHDIPVDGLVTEMGITWFAS